jgi:hypothetical protein
LLEVSAGAVNPVKSVVAVVALMAASCSVRIWRLGSL